MGREVLGGQAAGEDARHPINLQSWLKGAEMSAQYHVLGSPGTARRASWQSRWAEVPLQL